MKKFIAAMLSAVMTMSFGVIAFGADTMDIDCQLSESSVSVGDTFYADFKVTDNPNGYNSMSAMVRYDSSVIRAIECEIEDIADDQILYYNENGNALALFPYNAVNERITHVPNPSDYYYDGEADGVRSASEIGIIRLSRFLGVTVDNYLQNYEGTGTILRIKFEAVGSGSSSIELTDIVSSYFDTGVSRDIDVNVNSGYVSVEGDNQTNESTTETTTTSTSGDNNSSTGSSTGGTSTGSNVTTTTEATTEAATVEATEATTSSVTSEAISFTDVSADYWAEPYIINLASQGIVNGYPDGSFKPGDYVTRADFLIMLLRSMNIDTTNSGTSTFTDVDANAYYANACSIAKDMGIASGNPDGSFNPRGYITRQDMMILAKKAAEAKLGREITGDVSVLDRFADRADISAYAVDSLAAMVEEGIVNGMGDNIAPKANTTRAQAAVIIDNVMKL